MNLLRVLVASCLIATVPVAALAGAIDPGHCKTTAAPAQIPSAMDHSRHAVHMADDAASVDAEHGKAFKASNGCECGCNCATGHCASGSSGFLGAAVGVGLGGLTEQHPLPYAAAHISAAYHLDLLRPPARA